MIDEKKIKKAAKAYDKEKRTLLDKMWEREYSKTGKNPGFIQVCPDIAFKDGAKWAQQEFVKSLWHDASEEKPKENIPVVIFYEKGDYSIANCPLAEWAEKEYGWKFAKKWLYVRDLLPEEKGGEL